MLILHVGKKFFSGFFGIHTFLFVLDIVFIS